MMAMTSTPDQHPDADATGARMRRAVSDFTRGWRQFWQGYWQSAHSC